MVLISCKDKKTADPGKEKIDNSCAVVMQAFSDGRFQDAMRILKVNSFIDAAQLDTLHEKIVGQFANFGSYGKLTGYEFVGENIIVNDLRKRFYLLRFEKYYLTFFFVIYKSHVGWKITHFKYEDVLPG